MEPPGIQGSPNRAGNNSTGCAPSPPPRKTESSINRKEIPLKSLPDFNDNRYKGFESEETNATDITVNASNSSSNYKPIQDMDYSNLAPDSLFKQIEDLKWDSAIYYMQNKAYEVSQWVYKADIATDDILWRRLPIHEACIRQPSFDIIQCLLAIYPNGVNSPDSCGRLPLHHASIHGASTDIIYLLMHEYYEACNVDDIWGKSPKECAFSCQSVNRNDIIDAFTNKTQIDIGKIVNQLNGIKDDDEMKQNVEEEKAVEDVNTTMDTHIDTQEHTTEVEYQQQIQSATEVALEEEYAQAQIEFAASLADAHKERDDALTREKELTEKLEELGNEADKSNAQFQEREAHLINEYECVSNRNTHMKFAFDKFEAQVSSLNAVLETKNKTIKDLEEAFKSSEENLGNELENLKTVHKERTDRLLEDRSKLQKALSTLTAKFKDVQGNIAKYSKAQLEGQTKEYEDKLGKQSKLLNESLEKVTLLGENLEKVTKERDELKESKERLRERNEKTITELKTDNTTLHDEKTSSLRVKKYLENEVYDLQDYRDKAEVRMDALEDLVAELEVKYDDAQKASVEYKELYDKANNEVNERNAMLDDMESEMHAMIEKQKNFDDEKYEFQRNLSDLTQENVKYQIEIKELEKYRSAQVDQDVKKSFRRENISSSLRSRHSHDEESTVSTISTSARRQKELLDNALKFINSK